MSVRIVRAALRRAGLTALSFELTTSLKWKLVGADGRTFKTREEALASTDQQVVTIPIEEYTLIAHVAERDVEVIKAARILDIGDGAVPILLQAQSFDTNGAYTEICYTAVRNGD